MPSIIIADECLFKILRPADMMMPFLLNASTPEMIYIDSRARGQFRTALRTRR